MTHDSTPDTGAPDGVVKYRAEHENAPAPRSPLLPALTAARERLFDRAFIGVYPSGIGYGNVSVRVENGAGRGDAFIISGTATGAKRLLSPEDYCLVISFNIEENHVHSAGPIQASSESMTHGAIYRALPSVNCVIHIHNLLIFDAMLRGDFPATPREAAYGTPEMAFSVMQTAREADMAHKSVLVMAGHDEGIIAWGASVEATERRIDELYCLYENNAN